MLEETTVLPALKHADVDSTVGKVYDALKEKGYDPVAQLCGYIISGDPTYITSHKNSRSIITRVEPYEILERMAEVYIDKVIENSKDTTDNN